MLFPLIAAVLTITATAASAIYEVKETARESLKKEVPYAGETEDSA